MMFQHEMSKKCQNKTSSNIYFANSQNSFKINLFRYCEKNQKLERIFHFSFDVTKAQISNVFAFS